MYDGQTQYSPAVVDVDAIATGRILVVDDDRAFGGFMLAALESRGHEVEWAGSIADAMTAFYSTRYDLAIVDLRLPDGSGIDFLREATDAGLLDGASAIILTGHDFEAPQDIRVFSKSLELDPFLDRMADIVAHTQRRRRATGRGAMPLMRGSANDASRSAAKKPKIELVLYTSAASEKSLRAIRTVRNILDQYDAADFNFTICDLAVMPAKADEDGVVFTPTLVKRSPGPRTWIVGNLDAPDLLVDLLEVSGVGRRRR